MFFYPVKFIIGRFSAAAIVLFLLYPQSSPSAQEWRKSSAGHQFANVSGKYLKRILRRKRIIIGLQNDYQPFHIKGAKKDFPGIDFEIATIIGNALKVRVEYRFMSLKMLLAAVATGEIDLSLGGISSNLNRARSVNFTIPYLITTPAALLSRNVLPPESKSVDFPRREFKTIGDLKYLGHLSIGVKKGTTNEAILRRYPQFNRHSIVSFQNRQKLFSALLKGKIDALIADDVYIRSTVLKRPQLMSRFIPLTKRFQEEHLCMVMPQGDPEYWNFLNFFIRDIKRSGRLGSIIKKYLESDAWILTP